MFRGVRRWWGSGRGKVTARLFLFELCVVVLGVFIAQGLANFTQRQSAFAQMEEERSRALYEMQTAHQILLGWRAALPCLNARMNDVMRGRRLSVGDLQRPRLDTPNYAAPEPATLSLLAERHGVDEKNDFKGIASNLETLDARANSIIDLWGRLMLLDPANGQVTSEDRAQARLAAADIKAQLRSVEIVTDLALDRLHRLNVPARNNDEPGTGPARSCAAIWRSGRMDPPLTME